MAAPGSVRVWLSPHIIDARVELWDQSYGGDVFVGVLAKPGWMGTGDPYNEPYYMPGDPIPYEWYIYTVKFPAQTVDGVQYEAMELGKNFTFAEDWEYTMPITKVKSLSVDVNPLEGHMGDTFVFYGILVHGAPLSSEPLNLVLMGVGVVGSTTTDSGGVYSVAWVADRAGELTFYTEAPYV